MNIFNQQELCVDSLCKITPPAENDAKPFLSKGIEPRSSEQIDTRPDLFLGMIKMLLRPLGGSGNSAIPKVNGSLNMNKIKKILRSHFEGHSSKKLSKLSGVCRNMIKPCLIRFQQTVIHFQQLSELSVEALVKQILVTPVPIQKSDRLQVLLLLLPGLAKELSKNGMTRQRMWENYILQHPIEFQHSQFRKHLREYLGSLGITMHFEYFSGEKIFIDYWGKKFHFTDPQIKEYLPFKTLSPPLAVAIQPTQRQTSARKNLILSPASRGLWSSFASSQWKISADFVYRNHRKSSLEKVHHQQLPVTGHLLVCSQQRQHPSRCYFGKDSS